MDCTPLPKHVIKRSQAVLLFSDNHPVTAWLCNPVWCLSKLRITQTDEHPSLAIAVATWRAVLPSFSVWSTPLSAEFDKVLTSHSKIPRRALSSPNFRTTISETNFFPKGKKNTGGKTSFMHLSTEPVDLLPPGTWQLALPRSEKTSRAWLARSAAAPRPFATSAKKMSTS